jgi:SAM-dependent methyltransferase
VGGDRGRAGRAGAGGGLSFDPSSRAKLGPRAAARFTGDTLFDKVARAVCAADCLPRKELYESWEVARRVRRRFRGGRVVDLACGHGLVAHLMLLLDDSSPRAVAVDPRVPESAAKLARALEAAWPRLTGRVTFVRAALAEVPLEASDVVVSAHACGALTDQVLARALAVGARVAVLPCCQDASNGDRGGVDGWLDPALAIDVTRAARLRAAGYVVATQRIPAEITEKNRLLLGWREASLPKTP